MRGARLLAGRQQRQQQRQLVISMAWQQALPAQARTCAGCEWAANCGGSSKAGSLGLSGATAARLSLRWWCTTRTGGMAISSGMPSPLVPPALLLLAPPCNSWSPNGPADVKFRVPFKKGLGPSGCSGCSATAVTGCLGSAEAPSSLLPLGASCSAAPGPPASCCGRRSEAGARSCRPRCRLGADPLSASGCCC